MKKIIETNIHLKNHFAIISIFCFFIFSMFSEKVSAGIRNGIDVCINTLIPSLFLMLCTSSFFVCCGFSPYLRKKINKISCRIFGLSGNSAEAIFAGLTGGYNVATKFAVKLMDSGIISREEAKITAVFFTSPGLSFCINIAGNSIYGSKNIGIRFLISSALSSFICAFICQRIKNQKVCFIPYKKNIGLSQVLTDSVESASKIIFNICSWVILYYGISPIICALVRNTIIYEFINLFGEVTSGISHSSSTYPLELSSFILSFGGICIFLQQIPDINKLGINPFIFLLQRITVSFVSSAIFSFGLKLLPVSQSVFLYSSKFRPYSHSPYGSLCLMLLCAVFLISIKNTHSNARKLHKSL